MSDVSLTIFLSRDEVLIYTEAYGERLAELIFIALGHMVRKQVPKFLILTPK